jgi:hypothetical protein
MADLPDWTRAVLLQAKTSAGAIVTILVDAAGQLYALLRGEDASGSPQTVKVDGDGQLYVVLRGASGEDVLVDADGFLAALIKGADSGSTLRNVRVDADGRIIMVPRGQSGNYLAIDSDGFMTAILKGLQGSTLTTIGVNDDGQLECFVLDDEDQWGSVIKAGNSELCGRLGSPYTWDWRGRVLHIQDFSHGLAGLSTATAGTGAAAVLSPDYWQYGGYSIKLTGGSDGSRYAEVQGFAPLPPGYCFGVEAAFSCDGVPEYAYIKVEYYDATDKHTFHIRYNFATGWVQRLDPESAWQNAALVSIRTHKQDFHVFKLICRFDVTNVKIQRLLLDNTQWTATAAVPSTNDATNPHFRYYVGLTSDSGDNDVVYLDRVILTTEGIWDGVPLA